MSLRPQDLLVLYKHIASPEQAKGFGMLASVLHMSLLVSLSIRIGILLWGCHCVTDANGGERYSFKTAG